MKTGFWDLRPIEVLLDDAPPRGRVDLAFKGPPYQVFTYRRTDLPSTYFRAKLKRDSVSRWWLTTVFTAPPRPD